MRRLIHCSCPALLAILQIVCFGVGAASAQTPCNNPTGPDVIVGDLTAPGGNYASSGGIEAFDIGTTSCNMGTAPLSWVSSTNQHPVIGQNMFRLMTVSGSARFEQIGQSWLKHGFTALQQSLCCTCTANPNGSALGVGCSDPYCCGLNGQQTGLGPKFEVNPSTGAYPYPFTSPAFSGTIARRLQVAITDLDPALNPGAVYIGEAQYVTPDDAAASHQNNNASYRPLTVSGSGSAYNIAMAGTTQREKPAIRAWKVADPTVTETDVQIPGDGLIIVSSKATNLGGNLWHYEYAVHNLNSDRAIGSFSVPIPSGASVTNIGFHDVAYHSGEPFVGTDWTATVGAHAISWACETQAQNANANAIRWGTLYNFRFDINASSGTANATLGLWKPGSPTDVTAAIQYPAALLGPADCNNNTIDDLIDISSGTSLDCNSNSIPDECESFPAVSIAAQLVASGFSSPIYVTQAPGDNTRLFVVEQAGLIKIRNLTTNTTLATPFLDLSASLTIGGERGLLGLAFHPNYASNGFFYVYYTNLNGDSTIARFTVSGDPNVANAGSQVVMKTITQTAFTNHKAGCLQFGKDGMLYVGVGDGGSANDPFGTNGNGQNTGVLLGKLLRLDVDNAGNGYIPANNPFVGAGDPLDEIWAIGMRNPWRFSFDKLTGDLYIGDVGQDSQEEIDFEPFGLPGGRNYGWRCMEGTACTGLSGCTCNAPTLTLPIYTYTHASLPAGAVSETGGYVYRGCAMPSLHGRYFFGDYGQNFIKSFKYTTGGGVVDLQDHTSALGSITAPVSFGQDNAGELYIVSYLGSVYKIVQAATPVCGNGVTEAGEQCDDGNNVPGDGCFNCQFEATSNDNCVGATTVCTGVYTDTLVGATTDGAASCGGTGGNTNVDRWFKYVCINSGTLNVSTCGTNDTGGADAGIDTVISIHSGCPGNTSNQLACNDDWGNGGLPANACTGLDAGTAQYDSATSVAVTAGSTYYIRVSAYGTSAPGAFTLRVTAPICFPDCNNNGIDDAVDIANATSLDCAQDGIPDECQVQSVVNNYDAIPASPIAIPDNNTTGVTNVFNVPDHGTIQDLNLGLRITHTYNGDVIVKLTHNGVTRTVIDRPGRTTTGFGFNNDGFDGYLPTAPLLDDEGTGGAIENINVAAGVTSPPSYTPNETLAGFDGQDRVVAWTLTLSDNASTHTGSLVRGLLQFTAPGTVQPCPPDCNNNGIPDNTDIANATSADCDNNTVPDECQIAANPGLDCDGGPVGVAAGGAAIFSTTCVGCHNTNGQGGLGCGGPGGNCPGPNIRNKSRKFIWNKLLPPTNHPGGAHPEFNQQDFANLEAFLADGGSRGRPDNILDSCQTLVDCNGNTQRDACELEAGTAFDLDYNGVPDTCQCAGPATGDGNGDTLVNGLDIRGFVAAVIANSTNPTAVCPYDYSGNSAVGQEDMTPFIAALLAP